MFIAALFIIAKTWKQPTCPSTNIYGLLGWLSSKESTCDVQDTGDTTSSIPGSGRSPGGGHGNHSNILALENPMDRGAWQATVHGVGKSQTRLKQLSTYTYIHTNITQHVYIRNY